VFKRQRLGSEKLKSSLIKALKTEIHSAKIAIPKLGFRCCRSASTQQKALKNAESGT
jgi:hypothetical protein